MAEAGRIAITGASGFIGRHIVRLALIRGWRVRALLRDPASFDVEHPALETIAWEIGRARELSDCLRDADVLLHLAAYVPARLDDPDEAPACFAVNCLGTLALLEAAQAAGIRKFVHFSSANAYRRSGHDLAEDEPLYASRRAAYYLASKVAGETIVDHWRLSRRMSAVILRLSSVYGSGMPAKSFVHLCADRLLHGQTVELFNGGRGTADWVHVDDVAKAALSAAAANVEGHFNIGSGEATEIITVARHIAHCLGVSQDLLTVLPPDPVVPPGFGSLNIGRARRELGLHPLPLNQGLEQYCAEALAGSGTVLPQ